MQKSSNKNHILKNLRVLSKFSTPTTVLKNKRMTPLVFGVSKMKNDKKTKDEHFGLRMITIILLALVITYTVLYLMSNFGNYGLYFAGAIAGGLWGNIWHMFLFHPEKKRESISSPHFIVMIILLIAILLGLIFFWPLPQI